MKKTILLAVFCIGMVAVSQAQVVAPAPSPAAYSTQNVGFTTITFDFSTPGVKGRTIFGDLVPYGTPWRAGANQATTIEFSNTVKIGGENVRAGKYSIYVTPVASGDWTVHLNKTGDQIFGYMTDGKVDMDALSKDLVANISVTPVTMPEPVERLAWWVDANDNKTAKVSMAWADKMITFEVDMRTAEIMEGFTNTLK
ncbi:MAG: DUF2911 domain-containing protein [Cyclobacteriaceae bacterium]